MSLSIYVASSLHPILNRKNTWKRTDLQPHVLVPAGRGTAGYKVRYLGRPRHRWEGRALGERVRSAQEVGWAGTQTGETDREEASTEREADAPASHSTRGRLLTTEMCLGYPQTFFSSCLTWTDRGHLTPKLTVGLLHRYIKADELKSHSSRIFSRPSSTQIYTNREHRL